MAAGRDARRRGSGDRELASAGESCASRCWRWRATGPRAGRARRRRGGRERRRRAAADREPRPRTARSPASSRLATRSRRHSPTAGAVLGLRRGAASRTLEVRAERGCASRFLILPSRQLNAFANGRSVQVTSRLAEEVRREDELAAVLAHEFAHHVLRHRARLDAAGVERGLLGNFGRNARLIRETEEEADRLSVWLLARAGYDPARGGPLLELVRAARASTCSAARPMAAGGAAWRASRPRSRRCAPPGRTGGPTFLPPARLGRQEPALGAFEADRGQPAAVEGAGVDADPVGLEIDLVGDRVAVDRRACHDRRGNRGSRRESSAGRSSCCRRSRYPGGCRHGRTDNRPARSSPRTIGRKATCSAGTRSISRAVSALEIERGIFLRVEAIAHHRRASADAKRRSASP